MCFSPEASFTASGILIALGTAAICKTQNNEEKFFASIPLFFGIQQFCEGILWLALLNKISLAFIPYATYGYLFFALIFWPTWIPVSILNIERKESHKKLLKACLIFGTIISIILTYLLLKHRTIASIEGHHISYKIPASINFIYYLIIYVTTVTLPFFISSNKFIRLFGILNLSALALTCLIYYHWLTSIWCFFAAVLSCLIYWAICSKKI